MIFSLLLLPLAVYAGAEFRDCFVNHGPANHPSRDSLRTGWCWWKQADHAKCMEHCSCQKRQHGIGAVSCGLEQGETWGFWSLYYCQNSNKSSWTWDSLTGTDLTCSNMSPNFFGGVYAGMYDRCAEVCEPVKNMTPDMDAECSTDYHCCTDGNNCDGLPEPAADCVPGAWGDWSECSATCGGGTQTMTRAVASPKVGAGADCTDMTQTRDCNTDACCGDMTKAECKDAKAAGTCIKAKKGLCKDAPSMAECNALTDKKACKQLGCQFKKKEDPKCVFNANGKRRRRSGRRRRARRKNRRN